MSTEFNQIRDAYHKNMFASADNLIDVQQMYQVLADIDIVNDTGESLMHLAARFADADAIKYLSEAGLKPDTDKYGNTPLHALAATKFDLDGKDLEIKADKVYQTALALIAAGVNPKKKNDSGKVPYFDAGLIYLYPFIQAMGDAGVRMDATAGEGQNLLHTICDKLVHRKDIRGAVAAASKTVRVLIDKSGIDLEDKDVYDNTPLKYAQRSGVKEIAAMLSGDENDTVIAGMNIHQAILNRDTEAVDAIIKTGADLNEVSDQYRRTALMLACEYPSAQMVQLLVEGGADVNFKTGSGETAVYCLLEKGVSNFGRGMSQDLKDIVLMLRTLIKNKFDLDAAVNNAGDTALGLLCQAGYLADLNSKLAEELVKAGANLNKPNQAGQTPLMLFAQRGNEPKYAIAELLLDNNADINYADKTGNTALMYAAANADKMSAKRLVSLILEKDPAGIERVNNAGQTAMDIAITNGNESVVRQILA